MKRRIGLGLLVLGVITTGCSNSTERAGRDASVDDGWVQTVAIDQARRSARSLVVEGRAAPGARVVMRGLSGAAFAVAADGQGRFDLRVEASPVDQIYRAEVQVGQTVVRGADWLLVTRADTGILAVLSPGGASRRLDLRDVVEVVDHDGGVMLVSGSTRPGAAIDLVMDGRRVGRATADARGRWVANLGDEGLGLVTLTARGAEASRSVRYPGAGLADATGALDVEQTPDGVRVTWAGPDGARQTAWFPSLAPPSS